MTFGSTKGRMGAILKKENGVRIGSVNGRTPDFSHLGKADKSEKNKL
jgi:hypothetical protein